jgi:hypothetical protein
VLRAVCMLSQVIPLVRLMDVSSRDVQEPESHRFQMQG